MSNPKAQGDAKLNQTQDIILYCRVEDPLLQLNITRVPQKYLQGYERGELGASYRLTN